MRKLIQKILCAACVLFLSVSGATAEFSPRLAAMQQRDDMTLAVSGSLESLSKLSDASLEKVNGWLNTLKMVVKARDGGVLGDVTVKQNDGDLLSVSLRRDEEGTIAVFHPSGTAYRTGDTQMDALALLTGEETAIYDPLAVPRLYGELAKALYPVLEQKTTGKASKSSTSIKNATPSASFVTYAFSEEEMNAAWPDILAAALPVLKEAMADQPGRFAAYSQLLSALRFSGECRFKRFLTKEQEDMGLQFTGNAAQGEDVRKVTLFGGYTAGKGGYLSFSAPAVKGKNTLKYSISGKLTEAKSGVRTLTIETSYTRTLNGETESSGINLSLKNTVKEDKEAWSGKITWTETKNKVKTAYTLTPELAFTEDGLAGTVKATRKTGSKTDLKATLQLTLTDSESLTEDEPENVQDLRQMDQARAKAAVQSELARLTGIVARAFAALPEEDRALLTHELRTEEWMTADTVPADGGDETGEMPQELPQEEDTPEDTPDDTPEPEGTAPEEGTDEDFMDGDGWFSDDGGEDWFADDDEDGGEDEAGTEDEEEPDETLPEQQPEPTPVPTPKPAEEELYDDDWFGEDWFN